MFQFVLTVQVFLFEIVVGITVLLNTAIALGWAVTPAGRSATLLLDLLLAFAPHSLTQVVVRDADSIVVDGVHIGFDGVDALELGTDAWREAKRWMDSFLAGKSLKCELNNNSSYDRFIGVYYTDGTDIGAALIAAGHALDFRRHSVIVIRSLNSRPLTLVRDVLHTVYRNLMAIIDQTNDIVHNPLCCSLVVFMVSKQNDLEGAGHISQGVLCRHSQLTKTKGYLWPQAVEICKVEKAVRENPPNSAFSNFSGRLHVCFLRIIVYTQRAVVWFFELVQVAAE